MRIFRKIYHVIPVVEFDSLNPELSIVWEFHYLLGFKIGISTRRPRKSEIAKREELCKSTLKFT